MILVSHPFYKSHSPPKIIEHRVDKICVPILNFSFTVRKTIFKVCLFMILSSFTISPGANAKIITSSDPKLKYVLN